jgi:hypothetical protein
LDHQILHSIRAEESARPPRAAVIRTPIKM